MSKSLISGTMNGGHMEENGKEGEGESLLNHGSPDRHAMMADFGDIEAPALKFVYQLKLQVADPVVIAGGPRGSRYLINIESGTYRGVDPDFCGDIIAPSSDLAVGHTDGSGVTLKVNVTMKNHDGAILLGTAEGRSDRDTSNPRNSKIQISKTFETGEERFRWMNNQVFVGKGFKKGNEVTINYFQVVDSK